MDERMDERTDERQLHDVLENGIGSEPPIVGGPEAVFAGARARVVRTRMMTGALSVAAVLGVAAGAVALGGGGTGHGGSAPALSPLAGPDATPTAAAPAVQNGAAQAQKGSTRPGHPAPSPAPGQVLLDGRTTDELLKQMLPAGLAPSHYGGQDSDSPQQSGVSVYGTMAIDDGHGHGLGAIGVNVDQNFGSRLDAGCNAADGCTKLPDGSFLTVRTLVGDKPTAVGQPKTVDWSAERVFPDGHRVLVGVRNYFDDLTQAHEKGWTATTTGHDPAVSVETLKSIAGDPRWTLTVPTALAEQAKHDLPGYVDFSHDPTAVVSSTGPKS
jgi:hypothetical protein